MERFVFKDKNGAEIEVRCSTQNTRMGFRHVAKARFNGRDYTATISYLNRTWESFKYQSVLKRLANKMAGIDEENQKAFDASLGAKQKAVHEECERWLNNFKKDYNALSDDTKKMLANSDIHITSTEQAESVMKTAKAFDAIKELL